MWKDAVGVPAVRWCSTIGRCVVDLIELTLNHGLFVVQAAHDLAEAEAILATGDRTSAVVDMDHDDSTALLADARRLEHPDAGA